MTISTAAAAAVASERVPAGLAACVLCGGTHFTRYRLVDSELSAVPAGLDRGRRVRALIERCRTCRLFRTVHLSDTRAVAALYEQDSVCFEASVSKLSLAGRESTSSTDELTLLAHPPPATLLDVGCGAGQFMLRAAAHGYRVTGVDLDGRAIAHVRDVLQLEACRGTLDALAPGRRFDVITAFGVLEHLEDPARFLLQMRERLEPGGEVLIGVPNVRSVNRWLSHVGPHDWDMFLEPGHLHHFDVRTLERLAGGAGLALRRWVTGTITIRGKVPLLPVRWVALEQRVLQATRRSRSLRRGYAAALRLLDRVKLGDMLFAAFEVRG